MQIGSDSGEKRIEPGHRISCLDRRKATLLENERSVSQRTRLSAHGPMLETSLEVRVPLPYVAESWFLIWVLESIR